MVTHTRKTNSNDWKYANRIVMLLAVCMSMSLTGCTALFSPVDSIPANRVPPQFLAEPQANKVAIDVSRLRQPAPEFYTLDADDVLGVFVEGVLGNPGETPPITFPTPGSDLSPGIGFPVPIREDGTLQLPSIEPIPCRGLTLQQVEALVSRAYRDGPEPILKDKATIIVSLLRERTHRVFVVRQDNSFSQRGQQFQGQNRLGTVSDRSDLSGRGFVLQLPAYKNDVLNALSQTGGLPGVNAKNEIRILRGERLSRARRDQQVDEFLRTFGPDDFPFGQIPNIEDDSNTIKIPLRLNPGESPTFRTEDIILRDGDIVYVDTRETDVYYTSGLLGGGQFPLPRDFDLDVLAALSLAGNSSILSTQQSGLIGGAVQNVPPTEIIILRPIPGDRQIAIRIDLNDAINDPSQRLLVRAGDTLVLRFKPQEEVLNFVSNLFFTFGISELFR